MSPKRIDQLTEEQTARFDAGKASATNLTLGVLTVAPSAEAFLAHPERGYLGIAPVGDVVRGAILADREHWLARLVEMART